MSGRALSSSGTLDAYDRGSSGGVHGVIGRLVIEWDGGDQLGPVSLGMDSERLKRALPGFVDNTENVDKDTYTWEAPEFGLSIAVVDEIVVSISAAIQFLLDGDNIVGLPVAEAVWRLGGETSREDGEVTIVETTSGIDLYCVGDEVVRACLNAFELIAEASCLDRDSDAGPQ